jgi:hypothetical protein
MKSEARKIYRDTRGRRMDDRVRRLGMCHIRRAEGLHAAL